MILMKFSSWFMESANVFSPYIVIQLLTSMIALSADLFQVDMVFIDHFCLFYFNILTDY